MLDNVERIHSGLHYLEPPALIPQRNGKFASIELGLPPVAGRGAAFGDIDNDGRIDAVVSVLGGSPLILYTRGAKQPGVTLKLRGVKSNRDAAGAVVSAGNQTVYATRSGSYLSASDGRVHLAGAPGVVEIRWPSGKRQTERLAPGPLAAVQEKE